MILKLLNIMMIRIGGFLGVSILNNVLKVEKSILHLDILAISNYRNY